MTQRRNLGRALAATAAVFVLPLTGCGSDDGAMEDEPKAEKTPAFAKQSGEKIVKAAYQAMQDVDAVHLSGNIIEDGDRLDLDVSTEGNGNCSGQLGKKGSTATFVATADATYIKANKAFWEENAGENAEAAMAMLGERWAKLPQADEFAELCDVSKMLEDEDGGDVEGDEITVGEVIEYEGHDVVELKSDDGKEQFTILIEVDAPHRILKLTSETPDDPGELVFDFDEKIEVDVPTADESVDLSKMG